MKNKSRRQGFSLVEVTLAIGLAAFCLLPIFGLLPIGLSTNQDTLRETTAASLAANVNADLLATPTGSSTSPYYQLPISGSGSAITTTNFYLSEDGTKLQAPASTGRTYLATVVLTPPTSSTLNAGSARILITWPGRPNEITNSIPTQYLGSFETVVGLNRN